MFLSNILIVIRPDFIPIKELSQFYFLYILGSASLKNPENDISKIFIFILNIVVCSFYTILFP